MDWSGFAQLTFAFIAGAWVYSCGVRHIGIVPGAGIAKALAERVADKVSGNGSAAKMPSLPRVTS